MPVLKVCVCMLLLLLLLLYIVMHLLVRKCVSLHCVVYNNALSIMFHAFHTGSIMQVYQIEATYT